MCRLPIAESTARMIYATSDEYQRRAAADENPSSIRPRRSYLESISQKLWECYCTLQRFGAQHLPVSGGLLQARAQLIAQALGVTERFLWPSSGRPSSLSASSPPVRRVPSPNFPRGARGWTMWCKRCGLSPLFCRLLLPTATFAANSYPTTVGRIATWNTRR